ncbi:MAG TPA: hypothetical protein VL988_12960 [Solirubrobacteraceae bacterium]|nr:hypothetical protein [Solirubrobacteraceae bacterium]
MADPSGQDKLLELRHRYAWDWFKHHADQRFSAFNFLLIVLGAVSVAYASAASHHEAAFGCAVAGLAFVVSASWRWTRGTASSSSLRERDWKSSS